MTQGGLVTCIIDNTVTTTRDLGRVRTGTFHREG